MKKILFTSLRNRPDTFAVMAEAEKLDYDVMRIDYASTPLVKEHIAAGDKVVVYAEWIMVEKLKDEGVIFHEPKPDLLTNVDTAFLGRFIEKMRLSQFHPPGFIKPLDGKEFNGTYIHNAMHLAMVTQGHFPEMEVLVSEKMEFVSEYRFWCADKSVCAASHYAGIRNAEIIPFAVRDIFTLFDAHDQDMFPDVFVVDYGLTDENELYIVEFNPIVSSGVYDAHIPGVFYCLEKSIKGIK